MIFNSLFSIFKFSHIKKSKNIFKNFSQNFGKIALLGVAGSERKIGGLGILPNKPIYGLLHRTTIFYFSLDVL